MRGPAGLRRGLVPSLALCGALTVVPLARADELPLPGPVVERPVAPAAADALRTEPLWELGVGVAGFRFDDYRGSDHSNTYLFPVPFFAYRGPILRADRDGARAVLFEASRFTVDVSLGASVPTKSKDDEARLGMPDLAERSRSVQPRRPDPFERPR